MADRSLGGLKKTDWLSVHYTECLSVNGMISYKGQKTTGCEKKARKNNINQGTYS